MHYIRPLRKAKYHGAHSSFKIDLLFTITTDLGDSILSSPKPLELEVVAYAFHIDSGAETRWVLTQKGQLRWSAGTRVLQPILHIPRPVQEAAMTGAYQVYICVSPTAVDVTAHDVSKVIGVDLGGPVKKSRENEGLVMPMWLRQNQDESDSDIVVRRLDLGLSRKGSLHDFEVDEEIGESIARHVWDGGIIALSTVANILSPPSAPQPSHVCLCSINEMFANDSLPINILELGCGTGLLGLGLAALVSARETAKAGKSSVLLTDVEEVSEQNKKSISRFKDKRRRESREVEHDDMQLDYEALDWDDGNRGKLGEKVSAKRWDLIIVSDCTYNVDMAPALVGTLSAVHENNSAANSKDLVRERGNWYGNATIGENKEDMEDHEGRNQQGEWETKLLLATKPRHEDEAAVFGLLEKAEWKMVSSIAVPLPVLAGEMQHVDLYVFRKRCHSTL